MLSSHRLSEDVSPFETRLLLWYDFDWICDCNHLLPLDFITSVVYAQTQDEAVAERMLEKVQSFIREARADGNGSDSNADGAGGAAEQAPLELEVLYDDSWLDEMACGLFLVAALMLMTRPYVEVSLCCFVCVRACVLVRVKAGSTHREW